MAVPKVDSDQFGQKIVDGRGYVNDVIIMASGEYAPEHGRQDLKGMWVEKHCW